MFVWEKRDSLVVWLPWTLCIESNPRCYFFITFFDWSRKIVLPSQPIRCKIKSFCTLQTVPISSLWFFYWLLLSFFLLICRRNIFSLGFTILLLSALLMVLGPSSMRNCFPQPIANFLIFPTHDSGCRVTTLCLSWWHSFAFRLKYCIHMDRKIGKKKSPLQTNHQNR